jgi:hypothetical protein
MLLIVLFMRWDKNGLIKIIKNQIGISQMIKKFIEKIKIDLLDIFQIQNQIGDLKKKPSETNRKKLIKISRTIKFNYIITIALYLI